MVGHCQRVRRVGRQGGNAPHAGVYSVLDVIPARLGDSTWVVGPRQSRHAVAAKFIAVLQPVQRKRTAQPAVLFPSRLGQGNGMSHHGDQEKGQQRRITILPLGAMDAPSLDALSRLSLAPTWKQRNRPLPLCPEKTSKPLKTELYYQSDLETAWQNCGCTGRLSRAPRTSRQPCVFSAKAADLAVPTPPPAMADLRADRIPRRGPPSLRQITFACRPHRCHRSCTKNDLLPRQGRALHEPLDTIYHAVQAKLKPTESRAGDALAGAARILESQRAWGNFPEGTTSKRPSPLCYRENRCWRFAAAYPHATVVPVALVGTRGDATAAPQMAEVVPTI